MTSTPDDVRPSGSTFEAHRPTGPQITASTGPGHLLFFVILKENKCPPLSRYAPVYWIYNLDDRMDLGLAFVSGETRSIYITYTCPPEGVDLSFAFASASTASILITQTQVPESIDFGLAFVSASTEVA